MLKHYIPKKLRLAVAGGLTAALLTFAPVPGVLAPVAEASDLGLAIDVLSGIFGTVSTYNYYEKYIGSMANDPRQQKKMLDSDAQQNGVCTDVEINAVLDSVMNQMLERGEYAIPAKCLPFRWQVNESETFNASCTPMNYISVNKGFLRAVNYNRDEIAGVLGHEMIHGLHQHMQKDVAKIMATRFGVGVLARNADILTGVAIDVLLNYNEAKNFSVPSENDADEYGFYLMASAGFNPGGFPAMVTRMPDSPSESLLNPDDHPETSKRLKRSLEWLREYSCGHVRAETDKETGVTTVFIDKTPFYTAKAMTEEEMQAAHERYSAKERAYFVAGGLARGFHDKSLPSMWHFAQKADGSWDFLTDDEVYAPLKAYVAESGKGAELQSLVQAAYASGNDREGREKLHLAEAKRTEKWNKVREEAQDKKHVESYERKAAAYNELQQPELALHEVARGLACNPGTADKDELLTLKGASLFAAGDYEESLSLLDGSLTGGRLDNDFQAYAYLYRGMVKEQLGDFDGARADCMKTEQLKPDTYYDTHLTLGRIYDAMGDREGAMKEFEKAVSISAEAEKELPDAYRVQPRPEAGEADNGQ